MAPKSTPKRSKRDIKHIIKYNTKSIPQIIDFGPQNGPQNGAQMSRGRVLWSGPGTDCPHDGPNVAPRALPEAQNTRKCMFFQRKYRKHTRKHEVLALRESSQSPPGSQNTRKHVVFVGKGLKHTRKHEVLPLRQSSATRFLLENLSNARENTAICTYKHV